jgi:hydrogenase maturation protease
VRDVNRAMASDGGSARPGADRSRTVAPLLVIAVGNPSRGDDALGPALLDRLHEAQVERAGDVELLLDFQLQVEHALDLGGRRAVLFVDASREAALAGAVSLARIEADAGSPGTSHALSAPAVLGIARRIGSAPPPAWQMAIGGCAFGLGEPLSGAGSAGLERGVEAALGWLRARRAEADADA